MLRTIVSSLLLLASAVNALIISLPTQGSTVPRGSPIVVRVDFAQFESGVPTALVVFQSPTGSQSQIVPIGTNTPLNLDNNLVGATSIAAIPIFTPNPTVGQVASPGFSNIFIGPNTIPVPYNPCYNPCFNPCINPCRPIRPICTIPRQDCRIPRRKECNIPRPRCRIRGAESYESSESQPEILFSGFSVYYAQAPEYLEQFEQTEEQQQQAEVQQQEQQAEVQQQEQVQA